MPDRTPRRKKVKLEELPASEPQDLTASEAETVQGGLTLLQGTKPTTTLLPDPDPCMGGQVTKLNVAPR